MIEINPVVCGDTDCPGMLAIKFDIGAKGYGIAVSFRTIVKDYRDYLQVLEDFGLSLSDYAKHLREDGRKHG